MFHSTTNNTGAIDAKMNGSVLEEKSYFKGSIHYIFARCLKQNI